MANWWNYRAYGINIRSDYDLSELPAATEPEAEPDLLIETREEARAVCERAGEDAEGRVVASADGGYSFYLEEVGYFWIRSERHVIVQPAPGDTISAMRLYTLGSIIGFTLHLRGYFVVHAAAVLHRGEAVLFVGESGAGKSTLAAFLASKGYPVLTDDMIAVSHDPAEDKLVGYPGALSFKLWSDSLAALELAADPNRRVANRFDKFFLLNPRRAAYQPHPIKAIFELGVAESPGEQRVEPCKGLEAVSIITHSTYRPDHLKILRRQDVHFQSSARIASLVRTYRLFRPWDLTSLASVEQLVAATLEDADREDEAAARSNG